MMFQAEQGYSFLTYRTKHVFLSVVHIQFYFLSNLGPVGDSVHIASGSDCGGTNQISPCDGALECCTIKQHANERRIYFSAISSTCPNHRVSVLEQNYTLLKPGKFECVSYLMMTLNMKV